MMQYMKGRALALGRRLQSAYLDDDGLEISPILDPLNSGAGQAGVIGDHRLNERQFASAFGFWTTVPSPVALEPAAGGSSCVPAHRRRHRTRT